MVTITVNVEEGKLIYLGTRPDGSAHWRMLRRDWKGTLPLPRRFQRRRKQKKEEDKR